MAENPDEALKRLRKLADYVLAAGHDPQTDQSKLAMLVINLDKWLSEGNPLPEDWNKNRA